MAKRKKLYRREVLKPFSKNKNGTLKKYNVGDTYMTGCQKSIEYLELIECKLIKS